MATSMQLASALARVAFLEKRLDNSVSREEHDAVIAERDFFKKALELKESECKQQVESVTAEKDLVIAEKDSEIADLRQKLKERDEVEEALRSENMDYKNQMNFWHGSRFAASSESMEKEMRALVGDLPLEKAGFMSDTLDMINRINGTHGADCPVVSTKAGLTPDKKAESAGSTGPEKPVKHRKSWSKQIKCEVVREIFELDFSMLPPGSKVVMRKVRGKKREEIKLIEILYCEQPKFYSKVYKVASCNVPGVDGTKQTKRPAMLFGKIPVDPSFARFYLEMKFGQNRSEGQIVEYLHKLGCKVHQATLNRWMHAVIDGLMKLMMSALKEEIRQSRFTHNDETRILVRSTDAETGETNYNTEYIHGIYSPSANLLLMLYDKGSRSHNVQMEIFEGSKIEAFIADRCSIYTALQKEFPSPPIRGACWIHFRRYLLIAYHQDESLEIAVQLLARIFAAEKIISNIRNLTETERVRERQDMCLPLVNALFDYMRGIREAGNEYGTLAQNAANYLLDDEAGFRAFLTCGLMEIGNNAIERCFRPLALGRRNWLQCGSHEAAEHTAFMYSLVQSCRLNRIDFGDYIEYVLREVMDGNSDYCSLLPNHVKLPGKQAQPKVA